MAMDELIHARPWVRARARRRTEKTGSLEREREEERGETQRLETGPGYIALGAAMATAADDRPEYTPASLTKSYVFRAFPFIFPLPLLFYPPGARYYDGETRTHSAKWSCSLPSKISTPAAKLGRRRTTFKDSMAPLLELSIVASDPES